MRELTVQHDVALTMTAERAKFAPYGLFGGLPAPKAEYWVRLPEGVQKPLSSKTSPLHFPAGTFVHIRVPGGGGYGPPQQRPVAAIQDDLDDGYIERDRGTRFLRNVEVSEVPTRANGRWVASRTRRSR